MKDIKDGALRIIPILILVAVLSFGCSHTLKFNAQKAKEIREYTVIAMDTVQDVLISWPFYSGWIRKALEPYKGMLPIPPEFWEAMDSLDELAQYCPAVTEPDTPPGEKCDFSNWEPEILVSDLTSRIRVYHLRISDPTIMGVYPELGPRLVYEGKKRSEFGTGYAAGDLTVMASSIVLETLKYVRKWVPEVNDILKYLAVVL